MGLVRKDLTIYSIYHRGEKDYMHCKKTSFKCFDKFTFFRWIYTFAKFCIFYINDKLFNFGKMLTKFPNSETVHSHTVR